MNKFLKMMMTVSVGLAPISGSAAEPKLIGHRGASHVAPENTLASFKQAFAEGADGIEGDFQLSEDGQVVCMHDLDTLRTGGKKLEVKKTRWQDLAKLDVGSWKDPKYANERIPRLADVLAILPPDKTFLLEVKSDIDAVGPIAKVLVDQKADPARVILISFYPEVIAECRRRLPRFQAHLISSLKGIREEGGVEAQERILALCGAQGLQFDCNSPFDPEWIQGLKKQGMGLASWAVDDVATAKKVTAAGVDYITTNRPGPLRKELEGK